MQIIVDKKCNQSAIRNKSKSYCLMVLLLIAIIPASAQKYVEFGANVGPAYYIGDVNPGKHFYSTNLSFGGFGKVHFNSRSVLKVGILYTKLSGSDSDFDNQFQILRDHSFKTSLLEFGAFYEVHFLKYSIVDTKKLSFTPYLQLGFVTYFAKAAENRFNLAIPIGFGIKKNILPRTVFSMEWGFRKTFSDLLDSLSGEDLNNYDTKQPTAITSANNIKQSGFKYNKDWYSVISISLSYTFRIGGIRCNAY